MVIQRQLLNDYREDVRTYEEGMDQTRIIGHSDNIYIFKFTIDSIFGINFSAICS